MSWKRLSTSRSRLRGVSLTELMLGLVVASIVFVGVYSMMRSLRKQTRTMEMGQRMDQTLDRFVSLMTADLVHAGSDPTGEALQAYILEDTCAGLILLKYGINPEPADPTCSVRLGNIGILSYLAYDANEDGVIDPEEGLDLVTKPPSLRSQVGDYIVYDYTDSNGDDANDAISRKDLGDPTTTNDDTEEIILENVVQFDLRYYGIDEAGVYGEVTESTRHDDIREVEVTTVVHARAPEEGYSNPTLAPGSPFRTYRTAAATFQVPLIVRKE